MVVTRTSNKKRVATREEAIRMEEVAREDINVDLFLLRRKIIKGIKTRAETPIRTESMEMQLIKLLEEERNTRLNIDLILIQLTKFILVIGIKILLLLS